MKMWSLLLTVFALVSVNRAQGQRLVLDQTEYSCLELREILKEHRSIWVKNRLLPFIEQNVAISRPVCNGAAKSHPNRICRYYRGYVTASDGACHIGRECSCRKPNGDEN